MDVGVAVQCLDDGQPQRHVVGQHGAQRDQRGDLQAAARGCRETAGEACIRREDALRPVTMNCDIAVTRDSNFFSYA